MSGRKRPNARNPAICNQHRHPLYPTAPRRHDHSTTARTIRTTPPAITTRHTDKPYTCKIHCKPHPRIQINWCPARPCRAALEVARKIHVKIVFAGAAGHPEGGQHA